MRKSAAIIFRFKRLADLCSQIDNGIQLSCIGRLMPLSEYCKDSGSLTLLLNDIITNLENLQDENYTF